MPNTRQSAYCYVDEWKRLWEPDLEAIAYNGITCDPTRVDPKVLDWIHENCVPEKPHFVKVINRNAARDQPGLIAKSSPCLAVPAPFAQEHFTKLQRVVTLEKNGEPGRKWKVAFCAAQRHPLWLLGWKRFATDNDLRPGDVVVFELTQDSHFHFTKFDEDGNICQACDNATRDSQTRSQQQQLSSATDLDDNPKRGVSSGSAPEEETDPGSSSKATTPCKRRRLQKLADKVQSTTNTLLEGETPANASTVLRPTIEDSRVDSTNYQNLDDSFNPLTFTIFSKRRTVTAVELQRAHDMAEAYARTITTSPHFLLVMTHAHVYQHFHLVLPDGFVKEAKLPTSKSRMILEDCIGKTWEVHGRENVKFHVQLYRKPWAVFALQHLLEEGDVCVFQLTCHKTRTILVRIFRVVPIPMLEDRRPSYRDHYELQVRPHTTRPGSIS